MYIKPAREDIRVPDPGRLGSPAEIYYLPADGRDVGDDNAFYWARRIMDGDVQRCAPPAAVVVPSESAEAQAAEADDLPAAPAP